MIDRLPKPPWLKTRLPGGRPYGRVKGTVAGAGLHTVCEEARCPNLGECWGCGTATFLLLGDTCTRACRFCAVKTGNPHGALDDDEPARVARAVAEWSLRYVVLTSVDRDDLPDGGAAVFARSVSAIRAARPEAHVECLVPDFRGRREDIATVLAAGPVVYAHNVEVVLRLQRLARDPRASFERSVGTLGLAREIAPGVLTKSSLMLGLGETAEDIRETLHALRDADVDLLTLGQYLQPTSRHLPVAEYVHPDVFEAWGTEARGLGFRYVASGPLVRSSYKAAELFAARTVGAPS